MRQRQSCCASGCKPGNTMVYARATGLGEKTESEQVSTLLAVNGTPARRVFATFATNVEKIHPVLDQFEAYCRPRRNVPFERFYKRQQQSGETFDQYVTELPQLAINCNFYDITPEEILRHIILFEIAGGRVKEARMI